MKLVATYDMTMNLGSGAEPILRGQEFDAPPTRWMSREENARSLIRQGSAVTPDAWPKHRDRTEAKYQAARKMVEDARRASEKKRKPE